MERNTDREADEVTGALHRVAEPDRIAVLSSFFKTGAGEYGCGDVFIGVSVPANRKVAKAFYAVSLDCIGRLLRSEVHEYRLCALLMLVEKYRRAGFVQHSNLICTYESDMASAERLREILNKYMSY